MSNFLNSAYTALNDLTNIHADSVVASTTETETLLVTLKSELNNTVSNGTILNDSLKVNTDIVQPNNIIDQTGNTKTNKMAAIRMNNDTDINLYGTSSIQQNGSTAHNQLKQTDITGILTQIGNINQTEGTNIFLDSAIGDISQENKSISQMGITNNTLKTTTISDLTVTGSLVLPSDISIPGSNYNNDNITMSGTAIILQSGTGENIFKESNFTSDVEFDGDIIMTNATKTAYLKATEVTSLKTSGDITQSSGSTNVKSVISNDITINSDFDLTMSGDGIIIQTGTGINLLKDTQITNLIVTEDVTFPDDFVFPSGPSGEQGPQGPQGEQGEQGEQGIQGETGATPVISIGTVTPVLSGVAPTVTLTGTAEYPIMSFQLEAGVQGIQGLKGDKGAKGDKGDKGSKGESGSDGSNGSNGDSSAATAAAAAAAAAAGVAAASAAGAAASATAAAGSAASSAASAAALAPRVTQLENDVVFLNQDLDTTNHKVFTNTTDIDAIVEQISNIRCVRTATTVVDSAMISIGEVDNTYLQLGPNVGATSVINIGPTSQFGAVTINGYVTFPLMSSMFGYQTQNGFMNQFV